MFAILDSDHSKAHVLQELRVIARVTSRGDRVIVEDRCGKAVPPLTLSHHVQQRERTSGWSVARSWAVRGD
jgi:cephalosporin hydroxylase